MRKTAIALVAALTVVGCGSSGVKVQDVPAGNQTAATLDDAGSVHVSVVAAVPWGEIKEKLRPKLKVDEKDLRSQAIPATFGMLDRYLDILRLRASLSPTVSRTTQTATFASGTAQDDTTSTNRTTVREPGTPRDTKLPDPIDPSAKLALEPAAIGSINSSLTSRAIASYIQDVEALNAEVDNAARRSGYEPYLLRVQVSVMPLRRHLGYDVYSNLSFFSYDGQFNAATGAAGARTPTHGMPFVVPLLSTDAVETAQRSQNVEVMRDIGFALDLIRGFGSAGVGVNSQRDRQQALSGMDVNSLMTIGRLSENTVRVRFGAAYDPGGGFATHPRTNTISVLVFVPTSAKQVRVVSRASWVHTLDGHTLTRNSEASYDDKLKPIAAQNAGLGVTLEKLKEIDEFTTTGDYHAFHEELKRTAAEYCSTPPEVGFLTDHCQDGRLKLLARPVEWERTVAYLWSNLLALLPGSRFSTTVLDLPKLNPVCPSGFQLTAFQVQEKKGINVVLRGGQELAADKLKAVLHLGVAPPTAAAPVQTTTTAKTKKTKKQTAVQAKDGGTGAAGGTSAAPRPQYAGAVFASAVAVTADRKDVTLSFDPPNLEARGWDPKATFPPLGVEILGCLADRPGSLVGVPPIPAVLDARSSQVYRLVAERVSEEKKEDKKAVAGASLSATTASVVSAKNGNGTVQVRIELDPEDKKTYAISVSGADLADAKPAEAAAARDDGSWTIKKSGVLKLALANLVANQSIDIELREVDKEKGSLGGVAKKQAILVRGR